MPFTPFPSYLSRWSLFALTGVLSLTLIACDSGGSNGEDGDGEPFPEPPGRPGFTLTITGTWQASLSESAIHAGGNAYGGSGSSTVIRLRDEEAASPVVTLVASRPLRPGTHAIQQPGGKGVAAYVQELGVRSDWTSIEGELRIHRRSDRAIAGQFWLVASGKHGTSIKASGAFMSNSDR
jgi:hypothetical protein